jgi:hypothetical protein
VLYSLILNNPYVVGKAFEKLQTFWNGIMNQLGRAERDDEMWLDDVENGQPISNAQQSDTT